MPPHFYGGSDWMAPPSSRFIPSPHAIETFVSPLMYEEYKSLKMFVLLFSDCDQAERARNDFMIDAA